MPSLAQTGPQTSTRRVHIIGAGPVGLLFTALLQSLGGFSLRLYEKRPAYTRTRMVRLAPYLVADSIESYRDDFVDGENVEAVFDPPELAEQLAFRQAIPADLMALLHEWTRGFCALNTIERSHSDLIQRRGPDPVERIRGAITADEALEMLAPGDLLIDCTGCHSLLRDHLVPQGTGKPDANTVNIRLEYAAVITFLYGQPYECNEYCKYYKNVDNTEYKFIPAVDRTCYDGNISHVTGIVKIKAEDYQAMPPQFDGEWLRGHFPHVAASMDRFIDKVKQETHGEILGDLQVIRIPLNLYRARNATSRRWSGGPADHPLASSAVFLLGDSAIGSPYFQSISLGFESAIHLAGLFGRRSLSVPEIMAAYELYTYKQWMRVYMRSKLIKHNKDLFESLGDTLRLLEQLHIY